MAMTEKQIWQLALDQLTKRQEITSTQFVMLQQSQLIATQTDGKYILQVGNASHQQQLDRRCRLIIENALSKIVGGSAMPEVTIITRTEKRGTSRQGYADNAAPLFAVEDPLPGISEPAVVGARATQSKTSRPTPEQRRRNRDSQLRQHPPPRHPDIAVATSSPRPPTVIPRAESAVTEKPDWLNDRYTFDSYIVGKTNHFAWAACQAVADEPGTRHNPLFLYGGVGLGKTHLLHAIAHQVVPRGLKALYVTSETFTNEIINAIRYRTTEEFRIKYRSVDILLVDDIQFIAGKDSTEEEFFHTFNALHGNHRQIVICSDRPPKEIDLEERFRSRFEWGLIADIQPPDLETRLAILSAKADVMGVEIPDDCLNFLADRIRTNVREMEGLLNRVVTFANLYRQPLSLDLMRQALSSLSQPDKPKRHISLIEIGSAISKYYQVTLDELRSKRRDRHVVMPRQIAMWLMRQETEASLDEIGQFLGGRDHSTVMHGCDKIEAEIGRENQQLIREIASVRQAFLEASA